VVDIYLDRAAVIPEIAENSAALIANFGATDEILLEAIWGRFSPTGKLPFEMPSSMAAVKAQKEDVPYDSTDPLFPFDFGLSYAHK
jgi:beta-glucosidase